MYGHLFSLRRRQLTPPVVSVHSLYYDDLFKRLGRTNDSEQQRKCRDTYRVVDLHAIHILNDDDVKSAKFYFPAAWD